MKWKELKKYDIEDIVGYVNENILAGVSVTELASDMDLCEGTIRSFFKSKKYYRQSQTEVPKGAPRLFVKKDDMCNQRVISTNKNKTNECITQEITPVIHDMNTSIIHDEYIMNNMIYLSKETDTLREMIEWFKSKDDASNTSIIEVKNGIQVDLPEANIKRTTIRINETIWDEFDEFVEANRPYEKHTLMAQALKEFMDKHK